MLKSPKERMDNISGGGGGISPAQAPVISTVILEIKSLILVMKSAPFAWKSRCLHVCLLFYQYLNTVLCILIIRTLG